jgi:hypothetical protein
VVYIQGLYTVYNGAGVQGNVAMLELMGTLGVGNLHRPSISGGEAACPLHCKPGEAYMRLKGQSSEILILFFYIEC